MIQSTAQFKKGVDYQALEPVCKIAVNQLVPVFNKFGYGLTVTSTTDGKHSRSSLHYLGLAFDIRSREIKSANLGQLITAMKQKLQALDRRFQVIVESNHLHVEFDRRA